LGKKIGEKNSPCFFTLKEIRVSLLYFTLLYFTLLYFSLL